MKLFRSVFRVAVLCACVALMGTILPSLGPAQAQDDLQNTRFQGDPRLLKVRQLLDAAGAGDLRPATVMVTTQAGISDIAHSVATRFVLDLNATPVERDPQFELEIKFSGMQESENGYFKTQNYVVNLVDAKSRQRETLAQAALSVRCSQRCPIPQPSQWRQTFLRLGE